MPTRFTGTRSETEAERYAHKKHIVLGLSAAEIDSYVDTNVSTLEEAKTVLKLMIKLIKANAQ
jgi:hypothetical protein